MRPITLVLPYFMNAGMLREQQRLWAAYPSEVRANLHVVVVDDCSPEDSRITPSAVTIHDIASLRIYRLRKKRRWNWLACRNLGAKVATTQWLILTDIDHGVPAKTLERVMCGTLDSRYAYRFGRVTATGTWPYDADDLPVYKPHNDTWMLTRDLFFDDRVFGYDERLSGCYGTSGEFKDRVVSAAAALVTLPEVVVRYPREIIPDASTLPSIYTRKDDAQNHADLQKRKRRRAKIPDWKPLHGQVPSEVVYDSTAVEVLA